MAKRGGENRYRLDGEGVSSLDDKYFTAGRNRDDDKWFREEEKRRQQDERRLNAQERLGNAENGGAGARNGGGEEGVGALAGAEGGGSGARSVDGESGGAEGADDSGESGGSLYKGGGMLQKATPMGRMLGFLRQLGGSGREQKGPIAALISILVIMGGIILGAQSAMPFAVVNRAMDEFNSMEVSNNKRTNPMTRFMLSKSRKNATSNLRLIFETKNFNLTETMKNQLKKQGITPVEIGDGLYDFEVETNDGKKQRMSFDELVNNPETRRRYIMGAQKWRGGTSGWFGSVMNRILSRLGMTRNRWKDFNASDDVETRKSKYVSTAREKATDVTDESSKKVDEDDIDRDDDEYTCGGKETSKGTCLTASDIDDGDDESVKNRRDAADTKNKLSAKVSKVAGAAGGVSSLLNGACALYSGFEVIHTLVAAQAMVEQLNLATGYMEAVQKVQAGEGAHSPMNEYNDQLTQPFTQDDVDLDTGAVLATTTTTAMGAAGMGLLMGDKSSDLKNRSSVQSVNSEGLFSKINFFGQTMAYTADVLTTCSYMKMVSAGIDAGITIVSTVATLGIGAAIKSIFVDTAVGTGVGALVSAAMAAFLPAAAKMMAASYIDSQLGAGMGEALVSGLHKYESEGFKGNGGSMGTASYLNDFQKTAYEISLERAEYERETLSPFDITSENTFLGSIMYGVLALGVGKETSNLTTLMASATRLVSRSVAQLTPAANAVNRTGMFNSEEGDCQVAGSIGAMTDIYCNPYIITDLSTIETDPLEVYETVLALWSKKKKTWEERDQYGNQSYKLVCKNDKTGYEASTCSRYSGVGQVTKSKVESPAWDEEMDEWGDNYCDGTNMVNNGYEKKSCILNVEGLDDASDGDEYIVVKDANGNDEYVEVGDGEGDYVVVIIHKYKNDWRCSDFTGNCERIAVPDKDENGNQRYTVNLVSKYYASGYGAVCREHHSWTTDADNSDNPPTNYHHTWYWNYAEPVNFKAADSNPTYSGDTGRCTVDPELDSYGNPVINPYGELGVYITACTARTAPAGIASSEIASFMSGIDIKSGTKTEAISNTILGQLPVVGDIASAMDAAGEKDNAGWISGGNCVANGSTDWNDRFRWYQRYVEDQGWMENAGLIAQSSTVGVLDNYYEENPIDDSYEGVLARFSGLSKDEVEEGLALMDYLEWVAEYKPKGLGPVAQGEVREIGIVERLERTVGEVVQVVGAVRAEVEYGGRRAEFRIG